MTRSTLSPEAQLVLLSAGGPENDAAMRALLRRDLRWPELALLANYERAAPVLWRRLKALDAGPAVDDGLATLAPLARVWEFKQLHLEERLFRLLDAYRTADIDVVLLKGSGLAYTVYGSFAERPMSDVDLLTHPEDAEKAWELAQRVGWTWDAATYPRAAYVGHHHLPPLDDSAGSGSFLEIHTALFLRRRPLRFNAASVWEHAPPIRVGSRIVRTPCRDHQLLHACLHFAWSHALKGKTWRSLRDVWALREDDALRWDRFVDNARRVEAEPFCYWTLRLARSLAGVRVPADVLTALEPPLPSFVLDRLERSYALGALPTEDGCPSQALTHFLWKLGVRRSWVRPNEVRMPKEDTAVSVDRNPALGLGQRVQRHVKGRDAWRRYWRAAWSPRPG